MASKANMLKQGVNRTGRGLFDGFTPLNSREEKAAETSGVTGDIVKEEEIQDGTSGEKEIAPAIERPEMVEEPVTEAEPVIEIKPEPMQEKVEEKIVEQEISDTITKPEKVEKKQSEKPASRYEKEKFLLLDIRGYRDYVEHMAKASNMSATKYIRMLIDNDMKLNEDIYKEHKALEEKLRERSLK